MLQIKLTFDVKDRDQLGNLPNILSFCFLFFIFYFLWLLKYSGFLFYNYKYKGMNLNQIINLFDTVM